MKIYVASSWKNIFYKSTTSFLQECGHEIMDWQKDGFSLPQVTEAPTDKWSGEYYRDTVLQTQRAVDGFQNNLNLMHQAHCCVLLKPCGNSAHLEAGIFAGWGKALHIYIPIWDGPDLMYKAAKSINFTLEELAANLH